MTKSVNAIGQIADLSEQTGNVIETDLVATNSKKEEGLKITSLNQGK